MSPAKRGRSSKAAEAEGSEAEADQPPARPAGGGTPQDSKGGRREGASQSIGGDGEEKNKKKERRGKGEKEKAKKKNKEMVARDGGEAPRGPGGGGRGRGEDEEKRKKLKVHLARFVEYQPQIVTAMAYDAEDEMLAVARGNGDIQLWRTVAPRWHAVGTLAGSSTSQIRSVCWVRREGEGPRLFSGSLDGAITEWSVQSLGPVSVSDSQGGSVWCMAVSHSGDRLASACHDGGVRIFDLAENVPGLASSDGIIFRQLLPRHPGEALSVAWGPGDRVLITGDSKGVVRVWQLGKSGAPPTVQTVSIASNTGGGFKKVSLVWAVAVHADMTVWAADSKGNTHVIDARMGLVVKRFVSHHGSDVLTLATHGLNDCFSGGVDGRVVHYRRVKGTTEAGADWVVAGAARFHTHDIRCLCVAGKFCSVGGDQKTIAEFETGKRVLKADPSGRKSISLNLDGMRHCLVSAGLDTQLCLYTYDLPTTSSAPQAITASMRLPPWPFESCMSLSAPMKQQGAHQQNTCEVRMLACQSEALDLWRWKVTSRGASAAPSPHSAASAAAPTRADADREWVDEPRYALRIETSAEGGRVACASVSHDGQWIACGLAGRLTLYRLHDLPDGSLDVVKCQTLPKKLANTGVRALAFLPDSSCLVLAQTSGHVRLLNMETLQVVHTVRVKDSDDATEGLITKPAKRQSAHPGSGLEPLTDSPDSSGPSLAGGVNRLAVSSDGQWVATCDIGGRVLASRLPDSHGNMSEELDDVQLPVAIPALPGGVTAMRFRPNVVGAPGNQLVLVTAKNELYMFDPVKRKLRMVAQPPSSSLRPKGAAQALHLHAHHCQGITFNPRQPSSLILWGSVHVCEVSSVCFKLSLKCAVCVYVSLSLSCQGSCGRTCCCGMCELLL